MIFTVPIYLPARESVHQHQVCKPESQGMSGHLEREKTPSQIISFRHAVDFQPFKIAIRRERRLNSHSCSPLALLRLRVLLITSTNAKSVS